MPQASPEARYSARLCSQQGRRPLRAALGEERQQAERPGDAARVLRGAVQRQGLLDHRGRPAVLGLALHQLAGGGERLRADRPRRPAAGGQHRVEPATALGVVAVDVPEPPERSGQPQAVCASPASVWLQARTARRLSCSDSSRASQLSCSAVRSFDSASAASPRK